MPTWTIYFFPEESGLEKRMHVVVTAPPFDHPRYARRVELHDQGHIWRVEGMKDPRNVQLSRPLEKGERGVYRVGGERRRGAVASWRWLKQVSALEQLAAQAD